MKEISSTRQASLATVGRANLPPDFHIVSLIFAFQHPGSHEI